MSFWAQSDGTSAAANVSTEYDAGDTGMELIPEGSTVLAFIKEAKWKEGRDEDGNPSFINIQWSVEKPDELARRVVFQKLWVKDDDPNAKDPVAKRDKAIKMLSRIDAFAGGKLAANGSEPTDDSLALALNTKQMAISLRIWEMNGSEGNWVAAVNSKDTELKVPAPKGNTGGGGLDDLSDEIPFNSGG